MTVVERLASKYEVDAATGCWLWQGAKSVEGYGRFFLDGRNAHAHRVTYELKHGPVPSGLVLDHFACDTPSCVNPDHLRPTTNRENVLRGDTPAARHLAQTHCKHGHAFTPENTYNRNGARECRACHRASWHRSKEVSS